MGTKTDLNQRCEATQHEIEATRRRIGEKAAALKSRMTPREMARPLIDPLREKLGGGGEKMLDAFRENPLPIGLVGIGLGWLILRDMRGPVPPASPDRGPSFAEKASGKAHELSEKASGKAHEFTERAHELKESVKQTAGRVQDSLHRATEAGRSGATAVQDWFRNTLDANPWLLAFGVASIGAALGLTLPLTEWEKERAGEVGERLAGAALDKGREAVEQGPRGEVPAVEPPPVPAVSAPQPPEQAGEMPAGAAAPPPVPAPTTPHDATGTGDVPEV